MPVETVTMFLALLAVLAAAGSVLVVAAAAARRVGFLDLLAPWALPLAALVAVVTMAGSLYLSEVAHFPPCRLCWYQRIGLYPFAVILPIAAWRKDARIARYVVPVVSLSAAVSVWHMLIERNPSLGGSCELANPCSTIWVERFGFLTIPTMALVAAVTLTTLTLLAASRPTLIAPAPSPRDGATSRRPHPDNHPGTHPDTQNKENRP